MRFKGSKADLLRALRRVVPVLTGKRPDALGLRPLFFGHVGNRVLELVANDYTFKAAGATGADGMRWPPLAPTTLARRRRAGATGTDILIETGELYNTLRAGTGWLPSGVKDQVFRVEPDGVAVGSSSFKADIHQTGVPGHIPARPLVPPDGRLPPAWEPFVEDAMGRGLAAVVEAGVRGGGRPVSIRALVLGVEKRLRSAAVFDDQPTEPVGKLVGVQPAPGRPPATFGQWYAAVRWGGGAGDDKDPEGHSVAHGVVVTLTARLNYAPRDRQALRLAHPNDVYDLADRIAGPNVIHGNYDLLAYANQLIPRTAEWVALNDPGGTATANGYLEPLALGRFGPEREAPPGWVGDPAAPTRDVFVIDIAFDLARRIQEYGN